MSLTESQILPAAACNALIYIPHWNLGLFRALDTRYRDTSSNAGKKGDWSRHVGKLFCRASYGEIWVTWTRNPMDSPSPPVKILTFLDIRVYGI